MKKLNLLILGVSCLTLIYSCKRDVYGCTDSSASNHSNQATIDDGSCFYTSGLSKIVTLNGSANSGNWQGDGDGYCTSFNVSAFTQEVIDRGAILVYANVDNTLIQLPFSFTEGNWSTYIYYAARVGSLEICYQDDDGFTPNPGSWNFKVIVISPSDMPIVNDINLNSFAEVKSALNL